MNPEKTMENKKALVRAMILLSIFGLIISILLVKNHYQPLEEGVFCDLGIEHISCSLVNTSVYAELFHAPVAILGVLWFIVLLLLIWKIKRDSSGRDVSLPKIILGWSIIGFIFIIYMIIAEAILRTVCSLCTLVHLAVIGILVCSTKLYRRQELKPSREEFRASLKRWGLLVITLNLLVIIHFNLFPPDEVDYHALAQCLNEKGAIMYGSEQCGACQRQKALFGEASQLIALVECAPNQPHSQWQLCVEKNIEGTPTWTLEPEGVEVKRNVGFMSIESLAEFAGCEDKIFGGETDGPEKS